nr:DUF4393 domain-containing protein [uncultured Pseudomonas sp.]
MDLIKEIVESPAVLKEIYGDLAKPGVQQVGKALSTVIGLGNTMLWPVTLLNEKAKISLEQNLNRYRKKLEEVPEEEVCEVAPEVGVPIAEKLSYVTNEELSEMYTELLANASQKSKANVAHPSFVNAINNMSPDEAVLLKSIKGMPGIPFIEVRLSKKGKNEWKILDSMRPGVSCLADLQYPRNIHAYISNLEGLGFFQARQDVFMVGNNIYEPLENHAKETFAQIESQQQDHELKFQRGKIEITPFARLFIKACFPSK